ncbi:MAG: CpaF family protein, partial [Anaerolineaceae bacterium]
MDKPFEAVENADGSAAMKPSGFDLTECRAQIIRGVYADLEEKVLRSADHIAGFIPTRIETLYNALGLKLPEEQRSKFLAEINQYFESYGPITRLINDPSISEIMVNGPKQIFIERNGELIETDLQFENEAHVVAVINYILKPLGRYVDYDHPTVDARLPDGSRVNIVTQPVAHKGPIISIRKFLKDKLSIEQITELGTLTESMGEFLHACVASRLNIIVSGNTSSGKTTLLNILSRFIPDNERIITIEDAAELNLPQNHVVTLEQKPANLHGEGVVSIRDLVRNSLRMRPDRIIVGECRGSEALDMLQAMNTGHEGSLTTIHSNSPRDTISRIET